MPRLSVLPALLLAWAVARAGLPRDATVADLPPADELAARPEKRPASVTVTRRRRPDDPEGMTAAQIVADVRKASSGRRLQNDDDSINGHYILVSQCGKGVAWASQHGLEASATDTNTALEMEVDIDSKFELYNGDALRS